MNLGLHGRAGGENNSLNSLRSKQSENLRLFDVTIPPKENGEDGDKARERENKQTENEKKERRKKRKEKTLQMGQHPCRQVMLGWLFSTLYHSQ